MNKPPSSNELPLTGESFMHLPMSIQVGGDHYKKMPIQPAEFNELNNIPYCMANVIKYICRHKMKGGKQDLGKAMHYCDLGASMYEQTKKAWKTQCRANEWLITPTRFCKMNAFTDEITQAVLALCSVFEAGVISYLQAKQVIAEIIHLEYPPVRPR